MLAIFWKEKACFRESRSTLDGADVEGGAQVVEDDDEGEPGGPDGGAGGLAPHRAMNDATSDE